MAVYCLSAYESGATLSEETVKGSVAAPKGMVQAVFYSGMAGFIFIIALLFAMRDNIDGILAGPTAMPIVNIFVLAFTTPTDNGTSQETPLAALLLTILLFLNMFANGLSHMTITVRIAYAMARDNAVPFSFLMGRINPVTKIPDRAVVGVFIVDSLVCLLPLVSVSAFAAVTSLTSIGLQLAYAIPITLRLYTHYFTDDEIPQGSFSIGQFSHIVQLIALFWLLVSSIVIVFPNAIDPVQGITLANMNFTGIITGFTLVVAGSYWYIGGARNKYTPPPINTQVIDEE